MRGSDTRIGVPAIPLTYNDINNLQHYEITMQRLILTWEQMRSNKNVLKTTADKPVALLASIAKCGFPISEKSLLYKAL